MKRLIWIAAGLSLCMAAPSGAQQSRNWNMRFQDLDRNGDGVITRDEWRGNDRSFRNQDWNGDGKLSGEEVRPGAPRDPSWDQREVVATSGREFDRTETRFRWLDRDDNGRLSRSEWPTDDEMFSRLDRNGDNALTVREFTAQTTARPQDVAQDRFRTLDANNDGHVSRDEWRGSSTVFSALDANRDGVLTRQEALGSQGATPDEFGRLDANNDGWVSRNEWHWNTAAFDRLDANRDGRLARGEFESIADAPPAAQHNPTWWRGYERGRIEGTQAGKEDKPRHWDLEGQRELEQADSGYEPRLGNRADYQAGYREGFRLGYREGFGPR